jgi:hypothetical protein
MGKKGGDDPGIKVTDKRRFDTKGDQKDDAQAASAQAGDDGSAAKNLPEIDFSTFILSIATSAQVHLGMIANPATGKAEGDLALAKQTIDILGVLDAKTKGNLTSDEAKLLEYLLYDLRMMYVEKNKG